MVVRPDLHVIALSIDPNRNTLTQNCSVNSSLFLRTLVLGTLYLGTFVVSEVPVSSPRE